MRNKRTPQGYKVKGSGIQQGYKYAVPMPYQHRLAISRALGGRGVAWHLKIKETYAKHDIASPRNKKAWSQTRYNTYKIVLEDGTIHTTKNITRFCKQKGWRVQDLLDIANHNQSDTVLGSKTHKGMYCFKSDSKRTGRLNTGMSYNKNNNSFKNKSKEEMATIGKKISEGMSGDKHWTAKRDIQPWENSKAQDQAIQKIWSQLADVHVWFMECDKPTPTKAAKQFGKYNFSDGAINLSTWKNVIKWLTLNGDPRFNTKWKERYA